MSTCTRWIDTFVLQCETYTTQWRMACAQYATNVSKNCTSWKDEGSNQCSSWADQGSNQCSSWADQGHNECCDWAPCSWFCDAFYWIANWVCQAYYWVAKWVCLAWYWVANLVCQAYAWVVNAVCVVFTYFVSIICSVFSWIIRPICVAWGDIVCAFSKTNKGQDERIKHVFVLMLENRSFDHMLGFSGIRGTSAQTGGIVPINGLAVNSFSNIDPDTSNPIFAATPADFKLPKDNSDTDGSGDPAHEFADTLEELCGRGATYDSVNHIYPTINNSGFVANRRTHHSSMPEKPMKCYTEQQVPVITQLAREFVVCDNFFSSLPGPTWPNRFFMHAATSGGLDDSPSTFKSVTAELLDGFRFQNGSFYDMLDDKCVDWIAFRGDSLPQILAVSGMTENLFKRKIRSMDDFDEIVNDQDFDASYIFIEPNYGNVLPGTPGDFTCGNSQHPLDDITRGEKLIKKTYETIRNSPHWNNSVLIVTYDEHGGFCDHVEPPPVVSPGDTVINPDNNHNGFDFTKLGVRVPCIIASPFIPKNIVDQNTYNHASILATFEKKWGLPSLTNRDAQANDFTHLFTLNSPRDTPAQLVNAADSGFVCDDDNESDSPVASSSQALRDDGKPIEPLIRGFMHIAFLRKYHSRFFGKDKLIRDYLNVNTSMQAKLYVNNIKHQFNQDDRTVRLKKARRAVRRTQ